MNHYLFAFLLACALLIASTDRAPCSACFVGKSCQMQVECGYGCECFRFGAEQVGSCVERLP